MSEGQGAPADPGFSRKDILGLVIVAVAGFLGGSVFMSMVNAIEDPTGTDAAVLQYVAFLGEIPGLALCLGMVAFGMALFLNGPRDSSIRNFLGICGMTLGLAMLMGALNDGGGAVGSSTGHRISLRIHEVVGILAGLATLMLVVWYAWLRDSSLIQNNPRLQQWLQPTGGPAVEGVSAAEAEALQVGREAPIATKSPAAPRRKKRVRRSKAAAEPAPRPESAEEPEPTVEPESAAGPMAEEPEPAPKPAPAPSAEPTTATEPAPSSAPGASATPEPSIEAESTLVRAAEETAPEEASGASAAVQASDSPKESSPEPEAEPVSTGSAEEEAGASGGVSTDVPGTPAPETAGASEVSEAPAPKATKKTSKSKKASASEKAKAILRANKRKAKKAEEEPVWGTGAAIPVKEDLEPLYPPDVRLSGGIPEGARPLEPLDPPGAYPERLADGGEPGWTGVSESMPVETEEGATESLASGSLASESLASGAPASDAMAPGANIPDVPASETLAPDAGPAAAPKAPATPIHPDAAVISEDAVPSPLPPPQWEQSALFEDATAETQEGAADAEALDRAAADLLDAASSEDFEEGEESEDGEEYEYEYEYEEVAEGEESEGDAEDGEEYEYEYEDVEGELEEGEEEGSEDDAEEEDGEEYEYEYEEVAEDEEYEEGDEAEDEEAPAGGAEAESVEPAPEPGPVEPPVPVAQANPGAAVPAEAPGAHDPSPAGQDAPGSVDSTERDHVMTPAAKAPKTPPTPIHLAEGGPSLELIRDAGGLIMEQGRVAVSLLQREFSLDFKEATAVLDKLQEAGLIGPYLGGHRRDILLTAEEWQEKIGVSS